MPFCDQVPSPPIPQKDSADMASKSYETDFSKFHQSLSLQSGVKTPAGLTPEAFGFMWKSVGPNSALCC